MPRQPSPRPDAPVAVMFHRFGPYHVARLAAAAERLPLLGIELSDVSQDYPWVAVEKPGGLNSVTVFRGRNSRDLPRSQLFSGIHSVLQQHRPSAVALPGWSDPGALAALEWCGETGVPAILMSDSFRNGSRAWWKEWPKRRVVSLFDAALVAGTPQRDYALELGVAPERIALGYDAVDNAHFARGCATARGRGEDRRQQHGLPENYFLVTARFIEEKNLPRLLEAYARYRQLAAEAPARSDSVASAAWDLVLLGDGPLRQALHAQVSDLALDAHVHLPGFRQYDEVPIYYALADAFILPSVSDTWGLAVNEAMACGLPVLVSAGCGCARDLVQPGLNGFTFDPDDVAALAALMARVAATPKPRLAELGANSARIIQDWGPGRFAEGLRQAVEAARMVVRGTRPPASFLQRALLRALMHR